MRNLAIAATALGAINLFVWVPLLLIPAHAQNEKFSGDTTPTPLVIDLDTANGVDIVWHGVRGHLRPDQIAKFAHRLSLTCEPECHE